MKLRDYQQASIDATYDYLASGKGTAPLIVAPTGSGKTAIYNAMMRDIIGHGDTNVLMLTHSKELIAQGAATFQRMVPDVPVSIYSAGLKSKCLSGRAIFAGIQSVWRRAFAMPRIDFAFIDEAHLVSPNGHTMYRKFLDDLRTCNPDVRLIGLSATPFRLSSGLLHEGAGALFDGISYEIKILDLMNDGYLTRIVAKPPGASINLDGVGKRGGEFIESQLATAASENALIQSSVAEVIRAATEQGRKRWLIFACNIAHAELLCAEYECQGVTAAVVSSKHDDSDAKMAAHRAGAFPALINIDKLTTGYDDALIDLIAVKRSTMSVGLFIQIVGRGTRVAYAPGFDLDTREGRLAAIAAGPKPDCTLMDFGNNITTHGFIDQIEVTKRRTKDEPAGDAPQKVCPNCEEYIPAGVRLCPFCDHYFAPPPPNHTAQSYAGAVTSDQATAEWVDVDSVTYARHSKADKPDSVRVSYHCGMTDISEWLCPDHGGYATSRYTARMASLGAFATTTDTALVEAPKVWKWPGRIKIAPRKDNPRYNEIVQLDYASGRPPPQRGEVMDWDSDYKAGEAFDIDSIPF